MPLVIRDNPIQGTIINMGGEDVNVPALNIRQIKALTPDIKKMDAEAAKPHAERDATKIFEIQVKLIREGLSRNYPDISTETVENLVDLSNVKHVVAAVLGNNLGGAGGGK